MIKMKRKNLECQGNSSFLEDLISYLTYVYGESNNMKGLRDE